MPSTNLIQNIHEGLASPGNGETSLIKGNYEYWHYACDGFNDQGWGCGYRTLQTISSWVMLNYATRAKVSVPTIRNIQETLVLLKDKDVNFVGSREWIGSFEVCLVLEKLYNIPSKVIHVNIGRTLKNYVHEIKNHFERFRCPIMMGGDKDCSSKCIIGIHFASDIDNIYLLIVDPHFVGKALIKENLHNNWVRWHNINEFLDSSFYNMCLPQVK
ncbi:probable Ufm1-specific protease 1 [Prorops nasuta]|uniref:probable Ufm1-specific protease 1 n=1 Tax=Prorops nasuta TaxID=863751 RepID=UPI0034CFC916